MDDEQRWGPSVNERKFDARETPAAGEDTRHQLLTIGRSEETRKKEPHLSSSASFSPSAPVWTVCILSCWFVDWRSKNGECEKYSMLLRSEDQHDQKWLESDLMGREQDAHIALV